MSTKSFPLAAFATLLCGGTAIGFAGIFMRLSDVNPIASAFWRMALAAPLLWMWALSSTKVDGATGKRIDYTHGLAYAGLFFAGDMAFWHLSLHYTTVSNATLLSNCAPIFIALWLWQVHKVRFSRVFLIGMTVALLGAAMLVGTTVGFIPAADKLLGDGFGLASGVFYAAYQLAIKDARDTYSTARLMAWSSSITALALLPFALLSSGPFFPVSPAGWLPLFGLAFIAQIGGQTVIAYAMAHLSASLSSVSLLIQPLTATIAAWLLLQEPMSGL
ncbi:MAG: EamA/RhaT family transporter, partial [Paucimonas sp.]|nr:EamA/RhaT family transporter [Paucimonas sp.]